jgi:hypothetical protein
LLIRRDTSAVPGTRPSTPAIIQQLDCSRLRTPVRVGSAIDVLDNIELENVGSMNELATPWCSEGTRSLHPAAQQLLARGARPRSPISRPGRSSLVHSGVQPLAARGSVDSLRFGGPAKPRASFKRPSISRFCFLSRRKISRNGHARTWLDGFVGCLGCDCHSRDGCGGLLYKEGLFGSSIYCAAVCWMDGVSYSVVLFFAAPLFLLPSARNLTTQRAFAGRQRPHISRSGTD